MAERGHGTTYGDRSVFKLVVEYVRCPQCELIVPAFTGPEPLAAVAEGSMTRCGFCKWVFPRGQRMVLEVRRACAECGATMRAPAGAAVLVCPACDTWYHNPELDEADRRRTAAVLSEQRRIAAMVDRFLTAADRVIPPARQPEEEQTGMAMPGTTFRRGTAALPHIPVPATRPLPPGGEDTAAHVPTPRTGNVLPMRTRAGTGTGTNAGSNTGTGNSTGSSTGNGSSTGTANNNGNGAGNSNGTGPPPVGTPMTAAFASALTNAARECLGPQQREAMELRYGLDGRPGRTFAQIGAALRRSPSRARALLEEGISTITRLASVAETHRTGQHMTCSITVHVAGHAVRDPLDPDAPARIRAFVEVALPNVGPGVATDLVLRLSGRHADLAPSGRHRALRRAVVKLR
jgi:hypothetical protein